MLSKAEKAYETKVLGAAHALCARIASLPQPVADERVLMAMQSCKYAKSVMGDAFTLMDNNPSRFANHQAWHPRLRSLRNNTDLGERMFAMFE